MALEVDARWVNGVVKAQVGLPTEFVLRQNYPNPFNPVTEIKYVLPVDCFVKLDIYNILGEKVATLVDGFQTEGEKIVIWNGLDQRRQPLSSGIYFYRVTVDYAVSGTRKMLLLR